MRKKDIIIKKLNIFGDKAYKTLLSISIPATIIKEDNVYKVLNDGSMIFIKHIDTIIRKPLKTNIIKIKKA